MADRDQAGRTDGLGLADMVAALRDELADAQRRAEGETLRFGIADVEVEATVQITRSAAGRAGVQFWVVQAGGEMARGNATTHRIKLNLKAPAGTLIADQGEDAE
ncbi:MULTISPECIES: trypco2 family protein [unclassified Streptomyces]|uniref:trypco2 family protein n=1 Tax=unclassified Streptomyces TaxID=2593676 RepID=UPI00203622DA|nr:MULTISPECIES: trypco2 family protein [unclassified Streptomyces]